jgi:exosortase/archaeosortase family protein
VNKLTSLSLFQCVQLAAGILALILEVALLRTFAHSALGKNIAVLGLYSRDFYIPFTLACTLLAWWMLQRQYLALRLSKPALAAHSIALLLTFALLKNYDANVMALSPVTAPLLLLALVFSTLISGLLSWIDFSPAIPFFRRQGPRLFFLVSAVGLLTLYRNILVYQWGWLIHITGNSVYYALRIFGFDITLSDMAYAIGLNHRWLKVSINMSCSGLEGIFFLLFALLVYCFASVTRFSLWKFLSVAAACVLLMFAVNIVRVASFMAISIYLNSIQARGSAFFSWAFHANIGWVLYLVAIYWFLNQLRKRPHWLNYRSE